MKHCQGISPVAVTEQSRHIKPLYQKVKISRPPWRSLKNQVFPGDDDFVEDMQAKLPDSFPARGNPRVQLSVVKRLLAWYTRKFKQRDKIIIMAYKSGHYTRNEISEHFGISHTTVSRVVRQVDVQMETCPAR